MLIVVRIHAGEPNTWGARNTIFQLPIDSLTSQTDLRAV